MAKKTETSQKVKACSYCEGTGHIGVAECINCDGRGKVLVSAPPVGKTRLSKKNSNVAKKDWSNICMCGHFKLRHSFEKSKAGDCTAKVGKSNCKCTMYRPRLAPEKATPAKAPPLIRIPNCLIEYEPQRGVLYVHDAQGGTPIRICRIPKFVDIRQYGNGIDATMGHNAHAVPRENIKTVEEVQHRIMQLSALQDYISTEMVRLLELGTIIRDKKLRRGKGMP
jgi:hypothetical protein